MSIASWTGTPYSPIEKAMVILQDKHFHVFNAWEAQTAKRARGRYAYAMHTLEHAFNYLQASDDFVKEERIRRMDEHVLAGVLRG